MAEKGIQKIVDKLETAWAKAKAEEIEALHNDITQVIVNHNAHITVILTTLDIVKHEMLAEKMKQLDKGISPAQVFAETKKPLRVK